MSDFEGRLSAVLVREADDAPHSAGLAKAARRRHVVRRRRRVAVGGAAAVLAIAVPVAVLDVSGGDGRGDEQVGTDPTSAAPSSEWQTIEEGEVRAEIPGDWTRYTCDYDGFERDVYGPSQEDACGFGTYLAFYSSDLFDAITGPGVISPVVEPDFPAGSGGYVYAGDLAVSAATADRDLTRRILASARVDGQPQVDGSEWLTVEGAGIRVELPQFWGLGQDVEWWDYAVCGVPGERKDPPEIDRKRGAETSYVTLDYRGGRWISVAAPTQAVGDLVMASVETAPGSTAIGCVPREFGS